MRQSGNTQLSLPDMQIVSADSAGVAKALRVLESGGVIAHPTETCYGLACDLTNLKAVERLFAIKARPVDLAVSALFPALEEAEKFTVLSPSARKLVKTHLPGPLTIIAPVKTGVPHRLFVTPGGADATIGIRISSHPTALSLVKEFSRPISTTSANLHGKPNPYSVADIEQQFSGREIVPDLVLDGGTLQAAPPSTIVEVLGENIRIVRQGDLQLEKA